MVNQTFYGCDIDWYTNWLIRTDCICDKWLLKWKAVTAKITSLLIITHSVMFAITYACKGSLPSISVMH